MPFGLRNSRLIGTVYWAIGLLEVFIIKVFLYGTLVIIKLIGDKYIFLYFKTL
jgi:hypothetical protein